MPMLSLHINFGFLSSGTVIQCFKHSVRSTLLYDSREPNYSTLAEHILYVIKRGDYPGVKEPHTRRQKAPVWSARTYVPKLRAIYLHGIWKQTPSWDPRGNQEAECWDWPWAAGICYSLRGKALHLHGSDRRSPWALPSSLPLLLTAQCKQGAVALCAWGSRLERQAGFNQGLCDVFQFLDTIEEF